MTTDVWQRIAPKLTATSELLTKIDGKEGLDHYLVPFAFEGSGPYVNVAGDRYLMMSSYSYLGLNGDPRIDAAAQAAITTYGTGTHGVRLLTGTLPIHRELESAVAAFAGRPDAIVLGSGYMANVGTIEALCGPRDVVFVDKIDHASIIDGCRLSGARMSRFRHNDPNDLDRRLGQANESGIRLVVVDSVYSMDGDIAPLPELRQVCDAHGALLMVDEAHAVGNIGRTGRGIEEHFDYHHLVDIKMGTLSKAIPSLGGYVASRPELVQHLRYFARPFVFSAALPPAQAGAALEALRILEAEPERVARTQRMAARLRHALTEAGINTLASESSVIPVHAGADSQAYELASACRSDGLIAIPVAAPAVPAGSARLRVAVTAAHSDEDIEIAAKTFIAAAQTCGVERLAS